MNEKSSDREKSKLLFLSEIWMYIRWHIAKLVSIYKKIAVQTNGDLFCSSQNKLMKSVWNSTFKNLTFSFLFSSLVNTFYKATLRQKTSKRRSVFHLSQDRPRKFVWYLTFKNQQKLTNNQLSHFLSNHAMSTTQNQT